MILYPSMYSIPSILHSCSCSESNCSRNSSCTESSRSLMKFFCKAGTRTLWINVLFPLPETPATPTICPSGILTVKFFKLLVQAFFIRIAGLLFCISFSTAFFKLLFPEKYCPVTDSSHANSPEYAPLYTICPPYFPANGPISMI